MAGIAGLFACRLVERAFGPEHLAEADQAPSRVRLDRPERKPRGAGDLLVGAPVVDRQLEDPLLLGAQTLQGRGGTGGLLGMLGAIGLAGRRWLRGVGEGDGIRPPLLAPSAIDQPPPGNHRHERGLAGDLRIKACGAAPEVDEDLLDGVVRL